MSKQSSKAIITIGYTKYVVDIEDAIKLSEILANAEMYEEKWRKSEEGLSGTTYHVWEQDAHVEHTLKVLPTSLYRLYKLAGKPEEK